MHLMKWSRPETLNAVRDLSRFMTTGASLAHKKAMETVMKYAVSTPERGLLLKPNAVWNGKRIICLRSQVTRILIKLSALTPERVSQATLHF